MDNAPPPPPRRVVEPTDPHERAVERISRVEEEGRKQQSRKKRVGSAEQTSSTTALPSINPKGDPATAGGGGAPGRVYLRKVDRGAVAEKERGPGPPPRGPKSTEQVNYDGLTNTDVPSLPPVGTTNRPPAPPKEKRTSAPPRSTRAADEPSVSVKAASTVMDPRPPQADGKPNPRHAREYENALLHEAKQQLARERQQRHGGHSELHPHPPSGNRAIDELVNEEEYKRYTLMEQESWECDVLQKVNATDFDQDPAEPVTLELLVKDEAVARVGIRHDQRAELYELKKEYRDSTEALPSEEERKEAEMLLQQLYSAVQRQLNATVDDESEGRRAVEVAEAGTRLDFELGFDKGKREVVDNHHQRMHQERLEYYRQQREQKEKARGALDKIQEQITALFSQEAGARSMIAKSSTNAWLAMCRHLHNCFLVDERHRFSDVEWEARWPIAAGESGAFLDFIELKEFVLRELVVDSLDRAFANIVQEAAKSRLAFEAYLNRRDNVIKMQRFARLVMTGRAGWRMTHRKIGEEIGKKRAKARADRARCERHAALAVLQAELEEAEEEGRRIAHSIATKVDREEAAGRQALAEEESWWRDELTKMEHLQLASEVFAPRLHHVNRVTEPESRGVLDAEADAAWESILEDHQRIFPTLAAKYQAELGETEVRRTIEGRAMNGWSDLGKDHRLGLAGAGQAAHDRERRGEREISDLVDEHSASHDQFLEEEKFDWCDIENCVERSLFSIDALAQLEEHLDDALSSWPAWLAVEESIDREMVDEAQFERRASLLYASFLAVLEDLPYSEAIEFQALCELEKQAAGQLSSRLADMTSFAMAFQRFYRGIKTGNEGRSGSKKWIRREMWKLRERRNAQRERENRMRFIAAIQEELHEEMEAERSAELESIRNRMSATMRRESHERMAVSDEEALSWKITTQNFFAQVYEFIYPAISETVQHEAYWRTRIHEDEDSQFNALLEAKVRDFFGCSAQPIQRAWRCHQARKARLEAVKNCLTELDSRALVDVAAIDLERFNTVADSIEMFWRDVLDAEENSERLQWWFDSEASVRRTQVVSWGQQFCAILEDCEASTRWEIYLQRQRWFYIHITSAAEHTTAQRQCNSDEHESRIRIEKREWVDRIQVVNKLEQSVRWGMQHDMYGGTEQLYVVHEETGDRWHVWQQCDAAVLALCETEEASCRLRLSMDHRYVLRLFTTQYLEGYERMMIEESANGVLTGWTETEEDSARESVEVLRINGLYMLYREATEGLQRTRLIDERRVNCCRIVEAIEDSERRLLDADDEAARSRQRCYLVAIKEWRLLWIEQLAGTAKVLESQEFLLRSRIEEEFVAVCSRELEDIHQYTPSLERTELRGRQVVVASESTWRDRLIIAEEAMRVHVVVLPIQRQWRKHVAHKEHKYAARNLSADEERKRVVLERTEALESEQLAEAGGRSVVESQSAEAAVLLNLHHQRHFHASVTAFNFRMERRAVEEEADAVIGALVDEEWACRDSATVEIFSILTASVFGTAGKELRKYAEDMFEAAAELFRDDENKLYSYITWHAGRSKDRIVVEDVEDDGRRNVEKDRRRDFDRIIELEGHLRKGTESIIATEERDRRPICEEEEELRSLLADVHAGRTKIIKRYHEAAQCVQRAWRCHFAIKRVEQLNVARYNAFVAEQVRLMHEAASTINALCRGYSARKEQKIPGRRRQRDKKHAASCLKEERSHAAERIQRWWVRNNYASSAVRRAVTRKDLMLLEREEAMDLKEFLELLSHSASRIQLWWRNQKGWGKVCQSLGAQFA